MNQVVRGIDLYEIPGRMIPPGMQYQWCATSLMGKPTDMYRTMIDAGWTPVPFTRHQDWFVEERYNINGFVVVGGQTLMEKWKGETSISRDKEIDMAHIQAGTGRTVTINPTLRVRVSAYSVVQASNMQQSSPQWAQSMIETLVEHGSPEGLRIVFNDGQCEIRPAEYVRKLKYPSMAWLFNLITKDAWV